MASGMATRRHVNPAAERNKEPILQVLKQYIVPPTAEAEAAGTPPRLLEISSGSGQHVAHLAPHFPWLSFQPSEIDESSLGSIAAYIEEGGLSNVKAPIYLDVTQLHTMWDGGRMPERSLDYVLNINMIHITPQRCTDGLFVNCGRVLKPGGTLFTYGPYAFDGAITPESNVRFDASLRMQDPEWGLKDVRDLRRLGEANGFLLEATHAMPANNHLLVWKKQQGSPE